MKISKVIPFLFEDNLVIGLAKDWLTLFRQIPTFKVRIDENGKLVIESESVIRGKKE